MNEYEILNDLHTIFDLGWRAAKRGKHAHDNPFRQGTTEENAWLGGWQCFLAEATAYDPFAEDPAAP